MLLSEKPKDCNEIKNIKFMIIIGSTILLCQMSYRKKDVERRCGRHWRSGMHTLYRTWTYPLDNDI
jgi:hypothetical protein